MQTYFINGHTSKGFYHLANQFWNDYDLWVVTGGSMYNRGEVLSAAADTLIEVEDIDIFVHPNDGKTIDGILLKGKNILLLSDNDPLLPLSRYRGLVSNVFDLNDCLKDSYHVEEVPQIRHLIDEVNVQQRLAYQCFAKGKSIHEKKEEIYLSGMDFNEADKAAEEIISHLFSSLESKDANPQTRELFFGAASAFGPINYINDITEGLSKRIIIKGRSGSGKSTLMRKIVAEAEKHQLSVDYFSCALDPDSLDMVVIPALSFAIIDGTAPHVIDPDRDSDTVVDMFERCIDERVEEDNMEVLNKIDQEYKAVMKTGTKHLNRVHELEQLIHNILTITFNEEKLDSLKDTLIDKLKNN
ncbi:hypothetical protein J2S74_005006 [Evansella vedderi]|uniref:Uncharacterized protein n=1 Tax=Evansella vedderi TaxID=38282 RepID=A0ABU0A231_9BACI|nr:hypothetical protein [Evansella vedderi]MDQ0257548.1 hypothetical protein [Evansella vedderi]